MNDPRAGKQAEIPDEKAIALLPQVVGRVTAQDWNADLLLRLADGRILEYWAASDYGPAYWRLTA